MPKMLWTLTYQLEGVLVDTREGNASTPSELRHQISDAASDAAQDFEDALADEGDETEASEEE